MGCDLTEMLRHLPCWDGMSRRDDTKTIKHIVNEAFVATNVDIFTDYNDLGPDHTECIFSSENCLFC